MRKKLEKDPFFPMAEAVINETMFSLYFDKIDGGEGREIYSTKIPGDLQEGWIEVKVKSRNGMFSKLIKYQQEKDHPGFWKLTNANDFYPENEGSIFINSW